MAGETEKAPGICLRIHPWSRTSHVVSWLTPEGRIATVVKGAVRPKSAFLGQYDLNYTCELVYYVRTHGEARALRECSPLVMRQELREDWRAFALSDRFRALAEILAPSGDEALAWFALLATSLNALVANARKPPDERTSYVALLLDFELRALELAGLKPDVSLSGGSFSLRGERHMPISPQTAACIADPLRESNPKILLDAARAIGVYYAFHLENATIGRRQLLAMLASPASVGSKT